MSHSTLSILALCFTGIALAPAYAGDVGANGYRLTIHTNASRTKATIRSTQRGPGIGFGPQTTTDQLSGHLRVYYADLPSNQAVLPMPAPWSVARPTTIRFTNVSAPAGSSPVHGAYVAADRVARVHAKSLGGLDITSPPGPGGVIAILTVANASDGSIHRACSRYSSSDGSVIVYRSTTAGTRLTARRGVGIPCPITCTDGVTNGNETDIDCGGGTCPACSSGAACVLSCDCDGACVAGSCQPLGLSEGDPLRAVPEPSTFTLHDSGQWALQYTRLAQIESVMPRRTLEQVIADANNSGVRVSSVTGLSCFRKGFKYAAADQTSCWRPQGVSSTADAYPDLGGTTSTGRTLLAVSWHDDDCTWADGKPRGARITFIDIGDLDAVRYRKALLAEPCEVGGQTTLCAVNVHAGGIAWVDHYLYVVDTSNGLRVFDVDYFLEANTTDAVADTTLGIVGGTGYAFNYKYVLPQVGRYQRGTRCPMRFSWASLDRSSAPASILTGEYVDSTDPQPDAGRMFGWSLAADSRLAVDVNGDARPVEAWHLGQRRVQGGLARTVASVRKFWLTGSHDSSAYKLYRKTSGALEAEYDWADGTPQGLAHSPFSDDLWNLVEFAGRPVFACSLADVQ